MIFFPLLPLVTPRPFLPLLCPCRPMHCDARRPATAASPLPRLATTAHPFLHASTSATTGRGHDLCPQKNSHENLADRPAAQQKEKNGETFSWSLPTGHAHSPSAQPRTLSSLSLIKNRTARCRCACARKPLPMILSELPSPYQP
ncbi:hypothetical protein CRG98_021250 [Punica granatum]|uniref:Uncharacterized protein n=1 Tax=Punica granatum TaxID=22663 RepID=A0A2I0JQ08_PUNGR|nr:hypothetical protein CRG98_021250 [Punica granatum]